MSRSRSTTSTPEKYEDVYRLCYVCGPERVIVELAENRLTAMPSEPRG